MRKVFIIIFIVTIAFPGTDIHCQVTLFFDASPLYSFRSYVVKDYNDPTDDFPSGKLIFQYFNKFYDEKENPRMGFDFTAGINYTPKKWLELGSGIGFKIIGESVEYFPLISRFEYSEQLEQLIVLNDTVQKTEYNTYQYLKLPFDIQWIIIRKEKLSMGIILGTDLDILIKSKLMNHFPDTQVDLKYSYSDFSKVALNIHGGIQADLKLWNNTKLFISPQFERYITPNAIYNIGTDSDFYCRINQYNYYGQIKLGLKYDL